MSIGVFLRLSYMAGRKRNDVVDGVVCGGPASKLLRPSNWSCSCDGVPAFSSGKDHFETFTWSVQEVYEPERGHTNTYDFDWC